MLKCMFRHVLFATFNSILILYPPPELLSPFGSRCCKRHAYDSEEPEACRKGLEAMMKGRLVKQTNVASWNHLDFTLIDSLLFDPLGSNGTTKASSYFCLRNIVSFVTAPSPLLDPLCLGALNTGIPFVGLLPVTLTLILHIAAVIGSPPQMLQMVCKGHPALPRHCVHKCTDACTVGCA
eukprot:359754-Chlamydomonas_euryale.AAC.4